MTDQLVGKSQEEVAMLIADRIEQQELSTQRAKPASSSDYRTYYLTLFRQCLAVAKGARVERVLRDYK